MTKTQTITQEAILDPVAQKTARLVAQLQIEFADDIQAIVEARQKAQELQDRHYQSNLKISAGAERVAQAKTAFGAAVVAGDDDRACAADEELAEAERCLALERRVNGALPDGGPAKERIARLQEDLAPRLRDRLIAENRIAGDVVVALLIQLAQAYQGHEKTIHGAMREFGQKWCGESIPSVKASPNLRLSRFRDGHPIHALAGALAEQNLQWLVDGIGFAE